MKSLKLFKIVSVYLQNIEFRVEMNTGYQFFNWVGGSCLMYNIDHSYSGDCMTVTHFIEIINCGLPS